MSSNTTRPLHNSASSALTPSLHRCLVLPSSLPAFCLIALAHPSPQFTLLSSVCHPDHLETLERTLTIPQSPQKLEHPSRSLCFLHCTTPRPLPRKHGCRSLIHPRERHLCAAAQLRPAASLRPASLHPGTARLYHTCLHRAQPARDPEG